MFIVRGNNVFPPAVEAVIRRFPEVAEFRLTVIEGGPLARVQLEIEPGQVDGVPATPAAVENLAERVGRAIHGALSFRAEVIAAPAGSLPRFEMKARRFVRRRVGPEELTRTIARAGRSDG
jgi:phenylacetate-CoA ligase